MLGLESFLLLLFYFCFFVFNYYLIVICLLLLTIHFCYRKIRKVLTGFLDRVYEASVKSWLVEDSVLALIFPKTASFALFTYN